MGYRVPIYALRLLTLGTQMPRLVRDTVLFFAGLGFIFNEAVLRDAEPRFYLLLLYAAMIGLPAFLGTDDVQEALKRLSERGANRLRPSNGDDPPKSTPPKRPRPSRFAVLSVLRWRYP